MLLVDLEKPKTCKSCPMNCRGYIAPEHGIHFDDVICRTDYKKHEPMDDGCPIKGELPKGRSVTFIPLSALDDLRKQIADFKKCVKSDNSEYLKGYICALSAVEGMIAEVEYE